MKILKATQLQVETLVSGYCNEFQCWQYHDSIVIEIEGYPFILTRIEANKLIKFIKRGERKK